MNPPPTPPASAAAPTTAPPSSIDGAGAAASAAPPVFIDGVSGRVFPCIALREVGKAAAIKSLPISDQISGRVLPCVALRDAQIQVTNSPVPASCILRADLPDAAGSSAPSWAAKVAALPRPRLRSIVVGPGPGVGVAPVPIRQPRCPRFPSAGSAVRVGRLISADAPWIHAQSPSLQDGDAAPWTEVVSRGAAAQARLQARKAASGSSVVRHYRPGSAAATASEAFKKRFGNVCFRRLGSRHKSFQCRDPLTCYSCKRPGHLERGCPERLRRKSTASSCQVEPVPKPISPAAPSVTPSQSPPSAAARPAAVGAVPAVSAAAVGAPATGPVTPAWRKAAMAYVPVEALPRTASSSCKVVGTPAMEAEAHRLRSSALVLMSVRHFSGISAESVARVVERELRLPASDFVVSPFFPEDFLLTLFQPVQRDMALERRSISVAGVMFKLRPWLPPAGTSRIWRYYCRVAIEKLPLTA
ncbi:hypothetical protein D1007_50341 [Hordeum vulgare]|nr:hypothetical protein D1007_50341 [Hordeum vulgare]